VTIYLYHLLCTVLFIDNVPALQDSILFMMLSSLLTALLSYNRVQAANYLAAHVTAVCKPLFSLSQNLVTSIHNTPGQFTCSIIAITIHDYRKGDHNQMHWQSDYT
jgi:hypothetical protein